MNSRIVLSDEWLLTYPTGCNQINKGQENPEFSASGAIGSFPYNPVVGSDTYGNGPVGPEI